MSWLSGKMIDMAGCGQPLAWHGCYSGQTALLTEASIAHPAKMPATLCYRILEHLEELGLWKPDNVVLDPMAGTGMTGLVWAAKGGRAILVELEPKFIGFCQANKAQLERTLGHPVDIEIVQGDARNLSGLLKERGLVGITSPPYGDAIQGKGSGIDWAKSIDPRDKSKLSVQKAEALASEYGSTPGQIGSLPDKPLKVITSSLTNNSLPTTIRLEDQDAIPEEVPCQQGTLGGAISRARAIPAGDSRDVRDMPSQPVENLPQDGHTKSGNGANKGRKALGLEGRSAETLLSPNDRSRTADQRAMPTVWDDRPTGDTPQRFRPLQQQPEQSGSPLPPLSSKPACPHPMVQSETRNQDKEQRPEGMESDSQAHLVALTSPPYEDSKVRNVTEAVGDAFAQKGRTAHNNIAGYGGAEGQIGRKGEATSQGDYLSAMRQVYSELALVADICVVVVKNPTRNGKLRRLDLDTIALLEATGWRINCIHHSILFEEQTQGHLFEGSQKQVKGRVSFFKRLLWQKGKSEIAAWEDVLVAIRDNPGGLKMLT